MMKIPMEGPISIFYRNSAVIISATTLKSTLKRKHTSIVYHKYREAQVVNTVKLIKEGTLANLVNMLIKLLAGPKLRQPTETILY